MASNSEMNLGKTDFLAIKENLFLLLNKKIDSDVKNPFTKHSFY